MEQITLVAVAAATVLNAVISSYFLRRFVINTEQNLATLSTKVTDLERFATRCATETGIRLKYLEAPSGSK